MNATLNCMTTFLPMAMKGLGDKKKKMVYDINLKYYLLVYNPVKKKKTSILSCRYFFFNDGH